MTMQDDLAIRRTNRQELAAIGQELRVNSRWLLSFAAFAWLLEIFDTIILSGALDRFGVAPRTLSGLTGILTHPFLHGGFFHIIANTVPFLMLGGLIMLRSRRQWAAVSIISTLVGGLGIWLLGSAGSVHVGASGVVFGYFGYLLSIGVFERRLGAILISLFIGLTYGGLIFGMFPFFVGSGVSWEGHLFGFLGGILSAWAMNKPKSGLKRLTS